jgi:hypothetical protein
VKEDGAQRSNVISNLGVGGGGLLKIFVDQYASPMSNVSLAMVFSGCRR